MARAVFDQLNVAVRDMAATVSFYRLAGLDIPEGWQSGGGVHHVHAQHGAADLELDSYALARAYNEGFSAERARVIIGLKLESREAVDLAWANLIAEGAQGLQPPFDAFWGARYAIVEDPDGNPVGLMSPVDPSRRTGAPAI